MTPEARTKIFEVRKKQSKASDDDDKSVASVKSLNKTVKSLEKSNRKLKKLVSALQKCEEDNDTNSSLSSEGTSHFQKGVEMLQNCNPKIVLALKSSRARILTLEMSFCWTTSRRLNFVARRGSRPRSLGLSTLSS